MEGEEGSYATASSYDNWSIQHAIPQNDSQYSWITASLTSGTTAFGHAPKSGEVSGSNGFDAAITFISSSFLDYTGMGTDIPVDFAGINTLIYDPTGSAFNILSASDGLYVNTEFGGVGNTFNALMLHRNGAYGYPSWKQIRNRYHPLVRDMRESNTLSIIDTETTRETVRRNTGYLGYKWKTSPATLSDIFGGVYDYRDRAVLRYRESAIVQKYAPLELSLGMEINGEQKLVIVNGTYANEKSHFSNSRLNMKLNLFRYDESGADIVLDSLSDGTLVGDLRSVKYTETVYPKEVNTYLPQIRSRTEYVCPFWRDARSDRDETDVVGAMGNIIPSQSMWALDARTQFSTTSEPIMFTATAASGSEGVLQNSYNTVFSSITAAGSAANLTASATYNRRHTIITGSSVRSRSSFLTEPIITTVFGAGDAPWDAGSQSGKNPFYDTYGEYVEEMRRLGKDYSIVPEYRMSERMDYMIAEGGDLFKDSSLFSITGAVSASNSSVDDFYTVYSHSDFMKYFDVLQADIGAKASDITVKCKAKLKLLPYDGFYPANRTVQLATLFSQSYGSNVSMTGSDGGVYPAAGFRPFLTPMFAPGIVYNTIKSGIAVDFPLLTGSTQLSTASTSGDREISLITNANFDYRVPFEAIVEPEAHLANFDIIDMEPHPSCSLNATASWNGNGDDRYKMAMHNFVAETPDFFLENGTFTSFFSNPQSSWDFKQGTTYKMRVKIQKSFTSTGDTAETTPQIVSGSETICMYSRPTSFGPPCGGGTLAADEAEQQTTASSGFGGDALVGYNAPFTPPYYDGAAWVDIEYTPTTSSPSLKDVLGSTTSSYLRYEDWTANQDGATSGCIGGCPDAIGPQSSGSMNNNATQISASVNLFGSTNGLKDLMKYTAAGNIEGEEQWVIQTKFETPILNFVDSLTGVTEISDQPAGDDATNKVDGGKASRPFGMWHQYGRIPSGSEGISLEVLDIEGYASLADAVGFAKTSENLGKVAKSKTIREAVVAVPFIEVKNQRKFFDLSSNSSGNDMNLPQAPSDSVAKMIDSMGRYVFPPSMDFVKYPEEVTPFTMYIFEFEHQLNQQDLVDIWQNLPPRIGRAFDVTATISTSEIEQEKKITHSLASGELLQNIDAKLQWMVFKVKQKAQTNYWRKTVTNNQSIVPLSDIVEGGGMSSLKSKAVKSSDFVADGAGKGAVEKTGEFDRTYNWPYDFFSLVELVKIDEEVKFDIESKEEKSKKNTSTSGTDPSDGTILNNLR
jgi:hypothetical protein